MKPELIQSFMLKYGEYFDHAQILDIQARMESIDDSKASLLMSLDLQKPTFILLIAIFLGWERFFLDDIAMGVLKICTCYGVGIWALVDMFTAKKRAYSYNYKKFSEALMLCR